MGDVYNETALVALTRNDYLPDILYFSKEKLATFQRNTWKYPIPDSIVEILSDSTKGNDRGIKKEDYAAHGCREYWLVDTDEQTVEQYLLDEPAQAYSLFAKKTMEDHVSCHVIAGLSFPVAAIFEEEVKWRVVKGWLGQTA